MITIPLVNKYPGTAVPFLLFDLSFLGMFLLVFPRPRIYSYTFFASFLFLGFWVKFMFHSYSGQSFIEPVGLFTGLPQQWDKGLYISAAAAMGLIVFRSLHLVYVRLYKRDKPHILNANQSLLKLPIWYIRYRNMIWSITLLCIVGLNLANVWGAYYQVGINTKVFLLFPFNLLAAWFINVGFGIWMSCLIFWEYHNKNKSLLIVVIAAFLEGVISSITALSRSMYLFRTIPYFIVITEKEFKAHFNIRKLALLGVIFCCLFALSLVSVSLLRLPLYYNLSMSSNPKIETAVPTPVVPQTDASTAVSTPVVPEAVTFKELPSGVKEAAKYELQNLFINRWIGMEGILAVASSRESLGVSYLMNALTEDPRTGVNSLYQRLSKSLYLESSKTTFMTIPGVVAILYYSGSIWYVFSGMLLVCVLMFVTELFCFYYLKNIFLISFIGLSMANVLCQMNFPYLGLTFFIELWAALVVIWILQNKLNINRNMAASRQENL
ncbi:hypothetical protein [Paenibacillus periandrae]|uniref:hypothetical protein n=1 Tax=Paenibacillus periandrae TaxID=1761741 RepID=UPI001F0995F6|nr:hypothetical protein [Paenibacillus periandrae]